MYKHGPCTGPSLSAGKSGAGAGPVPVHVHAPIRIHIGRHQGVCSSRSRRTQAMGIACPSTIERPPGHGALVGFPLRNPTTSSPFSLPLSLIPLPSPFSTGRRVASHRIPPAPMTRICRSCTINQSILRLEQPFRLPPATGSPVHDPRRRVLNYSAIIDLGNRTKSSPWPCE